LIEVGCHKFEQLSRMDAGETLEKSFHKTRQPLLLLPQGPQKFGSIEEYPTWQQSAKRYVELAEKTGINQKTCANTLRKCLPDGELFKEFSDPHQLMQALEESYRRCMFTGKGIPVVLDHELCRYGCCRNCKGLKEFVDSLASKHGNGSLDRPLITVELMNWGSSRVVQARGRFLITMVSKSVKVKSFEVLYGIYQSCMLPGSIVPFQSHVHTHVMDAKLIDRTVAMRNLDFGVAISLDRLSQAREWFQTCQKDHQCHAPRSSFSPRRLLYVGTPESNSLRLVESCEFQSGDPPEYAALSYCWGPGPFTYKTTKNNIAQHMRDIPSGKPPKVSEILRTQDSSP
jgi:hypothetical protein